MAIITDTGCCPRFDPKPWDEQEITWKDRTFIRNRVRCFFHIPLNFGGVMVRNMAAIEAAGIKDPEMIVLTDNETRWGFDLLISVTGDLPGAPMSRLTGTYLCRVFEGPYSRVSHWHQAMAAFVAEKGKKISKTYTYYTTCPKCAKAYGKNYVVLLAQV